MDTDLGGTHVLPNPPPHGKVGRHGSEQGGGGFEFIPELGFLGGRELLGEHIAGVGQVLLRQMHERMQMAIGKM